MKTPQVWDKNRVRKSRHLQGRRHICGKEVEASGQSSRRLYSPPVRRGLPEDTKGALWRQGGPKDRNDSSQMNQGIDGGAKGSRGGPEYLLQEHALT